MKKNGTKWKIIKGSFGGSVPGKNKSYHSSFRTRTFTASVFNKGTVGSKLSNRR